jgi:methyl-accepting chemotaxis protein
MNDTDFDLLCEGTNPTEAKRLRKMLAEWSSGDENSFPVQLALLTKAQWRAIARMPHIMRDSQKEWQQDQASHRARFSEQFKSAMDDARRLASDSKDLLDAAQADHRRQIAAQSKSAVEAIDGRLKKFDMTVSGYNDVIHGIANSICAKAREFEAVAQKIQNDLKAGAKQWNQAKDDFDAAREKMNEERRKLQQRITRRDWIACLLFASMIFVLGTIFGMFIRR